MKISWGAHVHLDKIKGMNGYGYATDRTIDSLRRLGHEVEYSTPDADVHIHFDQPHHFNPPSKDIHTVMYLPWESTQVLPGWLEKMNSVDELWTPSPLIAQWYRDLRVKPPVYVFEHGVDKIWAPKQRSTDTTLRFLHVGMEAARKGGHDVMRAFRDVFADDPNYTLTLKMLSPGWNLNTWGKVNVINQEYSVSEMVELFHEHHVYVYPSWGEGFGLTPLQAMATGMPTIIPSAWAPYGEFLDDRLNVSSQKMSSPWPHLHPGKMLAPSQEGIRKSLRWVAENYDSAHEFALAQVPGIQAKYDWDRLTAEAFSALEKRLKNI